MARRLGRPKSAKGSQTKTRMGAAAVVKRDKAVALEKAEATSRTEEMETRAAGAVTPRPLTRSRTKTRIAAGSVRTATHTPIPLESLPLVPAGSET